MHLLHSLDFQIVRPKSSWSSSIFGFMAPSYTPLIWLIGLALLGEPLVNSMRYLPWMYGAVSVLFILAHSLHAFWVFNGNPRKYSILGDMRKDIKYTLSNTSSAPSECSAQRPVDPRAFTLITTIRRRSN
jgi:hypothetical protein